ncbi:MULTISPECIES: hypothetical protein [unclassified Leptotrichia]|uniref:hypothetical protein n=1 Tax=unclassified Leptotrichia TaxID=2633022 RepID=UPI0003AE4273|nr:MULTISPECIES: hypothetical protein [unclassified Leptotrichia]ERL26242.1 hypothetical protein HMPREF9108_01176 [Leptotrichia sp. oral taxon 225 str. F0581]WLD74959.1 hypothetical protein QU666_03620 [Leptotrichia sp. HMT-225]
MIINIYDKNTLEIIGRPIISNLEDFKKESTLFFPDFNKENHIFSEIEYQNPVLEKGKLRESTKEELYKAGKYILAENELVEDGKIKTVELSEFEYIENNQIKYKKEEKIEKLKQELYELRLEREKKPFEFEVKGTKYLQHNRTIDQSNITKILFSLVLRFVLGLMGKIAKGQKLDFTQVMGDLMNSEYNNWKFYTEDGSEKYVNVSVQKFIEMSEIMRKHTTVSMVAETTLSHSLENKTVEDLKTFNAEVEYNKLFESEIKQG